MKALRNRLGWSQGRLARAIDDDLDTGTVSRWERGLLTPQPKKREALARFAKRHGWSDIAAAFLQPFNEWKTVILEPVERQRLALFEIVLLNHEYAPDDGSIIPGEQFDAIMDALNAAVSTLKRARAAGNDPTIIGEEQAAAWLQVIGRPTKGKGRSASNVGTTR